MLSLPPLYPITDPHHALSLSAQIARLGEAGYPLVQFRGKGLPVAHQWEELHTALVKAKHQGSWPMICLNDRADLAILAQEKALGLWGLHLGQEDLPPREAKALPYLSGLHLGTSTHHLAEWQRVDPACDHAGIGPFRATSTKADHAPPIGLEGLTQGCGLLRSQGLAPVAIGGLLPTDATACFQAGAESLAMVSAIAQSPSPKDLLWEAQCQRWQVRPPFRPGQGIALIGGSGAGKSTLARHLALGLGMPCRDLDEAVACQTGKSIPALFDTLGEGAFRQQERECLPALLESPCVLALGAGAWESPSNRQAIAQAAFQPLWLAEVPNTAWERVQHDPHRPLAQSKETFMARWYARQTLWSQAPMVLPLGRSAENVSKAMVVKR